MKKLFKQKKFSKVCSCVLCAGLILVPGSFILAGLCFCVVYLKKLFS